MVGSMFATYVVPVFGCVMTAIMFGVPLPAVTLAANKNNLGDLNPIPWVAAFNNCLGYTVYAVILPDGFIFTANIIGLLLALHYTLTAVTLLAKPENIEMTRKVTIVKGALIFGVLFWFLLDMVCSEIYQGEKHSRELSASTIGTIVAIFSVIYYASPLSTVVEVITTRNAASLHVPMVVVNFLNAVLWSSYGYYGIHRAPIWVPNLIGVILAFMQLMLICLFPNPHAGSSGEHGSHGAYRPVSHEDGSGSPRTNFANYRTMGATSTSQK